jgi:hypothetical protein
VSFPWAVFHLEASVDQSLRDSAEESFLQLDSDSADIDKAFRELETVYHTLQAFWAARHDHQKGVLSILISPSVHQSGDVVIDNSV